MRIYLINLDRSPERLAFMTAQLEALGLSAERLPAVDGSQIDGSAYQSSGLKPGEIGCFLSHRAAWQRLVASGDELALVLEDDVRLSQAVPNVLATFATHASEIDILKLDTSGRVVALDATHSGAVGDIRIAALCSEHTGTAGYIISAEAASDLLARSLTFSQPVDLFMFGESAVARASPRVFQAVPAVVAQEKRFRTVSGTEMGSVIRRQNPSDGRIVVKVFKEVRRWLHKGRRALVRIPSRVNRTHRYIRVPFA